MNRCIAVLDLPPRRAHQKVRDSLEAAAVRWNASLVWINLPLANCHPFWQKFLVCGYMAREHGPCQVLQLDNDMLVRDDCPSPFELVKESQFGIVAGRQGLYDKLGRAAWAFRAHGVWAKRLGTIAAPTWSHPNGGFYLYHTAHFAEFFAKIFAHGPSVGFDKWLGCDETIIINHLWNSHQTKIVYLPGEFNTCLHHNPHFANFPTMRTFVYHFVGGTKKHLPLTSWRLGDNPAEPIPFANTCSALCRLLKETFDRAIRGVEIAYFSDSFAPNMLALLPNLNLYSVELSDDTPHGLTHAIETNSALPITRTRFCDRRVIAHELGVNALRWHPVGLPFDQASRAFDDAELDFAVCNFDSGRIDLSALLDLWHPKIRRGGLLVLRQSPNILLKLRNGDREVNQSSFIGDLKRLGDRLGYIRV